jgi:hypothetical protein
VQGNTSTKFANSEYVIDTTIYFTRTDKIRFLDLMRQFRDKEVVVEGDKIVDAAGEELKVQA